MRLLITCEHGGTRIPRPYRDLLEPCGPLLHTHRAWDPGALALARRLARSLGAPLFASTLCRLLVDLNRSPHHPRLFSPVLQRLPIEKRLEILRRHYYPHRRRVEDHIAATLSTTPVVLHIAVHSFTPVLRGRPRAADVGLLYDPALGLEVGFARAWQQALQARRPAYRIRSNYPYQGKADGLCTYLRTRFPPDRYAGLELEINQGRLTPRGVFERPLQTALIQTLAEVTAPKGGSPGDRLQRNR